MILESFEALGTVWYLELFEERSDYLRIRSNAIAWLEVFESRYSRFLTNSWLSVLNQTGTYADPNPQFTDILTRALDYYAATNETFNIAVGERLLKSGYDESYSFTAEAELPSVPALPDTLSVASDLITLQNGRLDLGGIGKGYAIDQLAHFLQEAHGLSFFLINGGGDIFVTSDHEKPVTITLAHPVDRSLAIGTVDLQQAGFAASSPRLRTWRDPQAGKVHNHLLTEQHFASYVIASTATDADVWATVSCLNLEITPPDDVFQLIINDFGQVVKDSFLQHKDQVNYSLYRK